MAGLKSIPIARVEKLDNVYDHIVSKYAFTRLTDKTVETMKQELQFLDLLVGEDEKAEISLEAAKGWLRTYMNPYAQILH